MNAFERVDPEWFNEAFDCNVTGVARVTRAFLPHLKNSANARVGEHFLGCGIDQREGGFRLLSLIRFRRLR